MSRYPFPSRARRRGQALLLAVLIMIFAALLSASFLVVVSVNLNQTARQSDKNRAAASARAGLAYVNSRLTYSAEGERWRGELESVPPAPGDTTYNFYYTPLDIAQGWARTTPHPVDLDGDGKFYDGVNSFSIDPEDEKMQLDAARATGRLEMVKSPDPRVNAESDPQYLSTVQRVSSLPATDADRNNPNLIGATRITVIGLSADDPTAYNRVVAYKGGYQRSPIAQVMRTISNWDFKNNGVPVAQVGAYTANDTSVTPAAPTLTFQSAKDSFINLAKPLYALAPTVPAQPFTITLSNPSADVAARSVVVRDIIPVVPVTNPPTYKLVLASAVPVSDPQPGERIEMAANLGAPAGINYSNSATPTPVRVEVNISDTNSDVGQVTPGPTPTPDPNQVDGARVNGGLSYTGNLYARRLRSAEEALIATNAGTKTAPGTVLASGVVASESASVATINAVGNATPDTLQPSREAGIFASNNVPNQYRLVNDGWNRLKGVPSANGSIRSVSDFRPPNISSGEGLERYRNMARFSAPAASYTGNAALYGYGQGIYIDNTLDREKILLAAGPPATYREMTQAELTQMWLSKVSETVAPTATNFMRNDAPVPVANPGSLEQKHLRGWVGPDEFRPRGAEITLGNNTITITRDARDDANPLGASTNQNWKDASGAALSGVYTQVLPWPTTGVIFAEGNLRIKGNATNAPNSLTIVSMGNIYIEDSLSADANADGDLNTPPTQPRKLLLMARKNVVMNPTRILGRPDAQTAVTGVGAITPATTSTPSMQTLTVADGVAFKVGDYVQAFDTAGTLTGQGYVAAPAPTTNQVNLSYVTGTIANSNNLRTSNTPAQVLASTVIPTKNVAFNSIVLPNDVIQRQLFLPNTPAFVANLPNLRLAFNHQADRVPVLNVDVKTSPGYRDPTQPIYLSNKGVPSTTPPPFFDLNAAVVAEANKKMRGQYTEPPPPGNDDFPATPPATEDDPSTGARTGFSYLLKQFAADMNSVNHNGADPMTDVGWQYDSSIVPPAAPPTPTAYDTIPFFYLAGFGNRYDFGVAPTGDTRKDINATAYQVPLAVSIGLRLNTTQSTVFGEHYNKPMMPMAGYYDRTTQFGFSPTFLDSTTPPVIPTEDILTSDQGFYQTDSLKSTLDSRSPYDAGAMTSSLVVGANNSLVLRQSDNLVQPVAPISFPAYRLMGAKLENVALNADATTGVVTTASINPAYTFNVNAYVYAQTGSWFVIPGGLFDERLKTVAVATSTTTFLDLDGDNSADPGESILDSATGNSYPDLNRNGVVDEAERFAMTRYSRFNYQINFIGAIAENQTALVNTVYDTSTPRKIITPGAVDDWMTKWSTTVFPTPASGDPNNRIHYVFDPTIVANQLQQDDPTTPAVEPSDEGFKLPQTPDLFYQD